MTLQPTQAPQNGWSFWAPVAVQPIAAALAIGPVFFLFERKTQLQTFSPLANITFGSILRSSYKGAWPAGRAIGGQVIVQKIAERYLFEGSNLSKNTTAVLSAVGVAVITSPLLAALNGSAANLGFYASLKGLRPKPLTALLGRESLFLANLALPKDEEHPYLVAFRNGTIVAILSHTFDTAFTVLQNEMQIKNLSHYAKGLVPRTLAVGIFSTAFTAINDFADPFVKEILD